MKLQVLVILSLLCGCASQFTEEERAYNLESTRNLIRIKVERCEASGNMIVYVGLSAYKDLDITHAHPSDYICR